MERVIKEFKDEYLQAINRIAQIVEEYAQQATVLHDTYRASVARISDDSEYDESLYGSHVLDWYVKEFANIKSDYEDQLKALHSECWGAIQKFVETCRYST